MIKTKKTWNGTSKQIQCVRNVLQCAFCKHFEPKQMHWWICDKCWNKIWLKNDKIRHCAWSGRALKNGWVVCHVLTLSLDPDVPSETRVAFLCSLCCRPFFPKLPDLRIFVIAFVWGVGIEIHVRWHPSARTLGVRRTDCHTDILHLIPVLDFTSFAAHVKHHVLSDSIPFPFGLYMCVPLSCLDVKCTLDMNTLSPPALLSPSQLFKFRIVNGHEIQSCSRSLHDTCIGAQFDQLKMTRKICEFSFVIVQQVSLQSLIGPKRFVRCRQICWHYHGLWIVFSNKSP